MIDEPIRVIEVDDLEGLRPPGFSGDRLVGPKGLSLHAEVDGLFVGLDQDHLFRVPDGEPMANVSIGLEWDRPVIREVRARRSRMQQHGIDADILLRKELQGFLVPGLQGAQMISEQGGWIHGGGIAVCG